MTSRFSSPLFVFLFLFGALSQAGAAVPIPLPGDHPVGLDKIRVNNPEVLPLAGIWRFQLTHGSMTPDGFRSSESGPVTASSAQTGHTPADAVEGQGRDVRWCASDESMPQWWTADFGAPTEVRGLTIEWEFPDALYRFKVEGSADAERWKPLADQSAAPGVHSGPVVIAHSAIRFLRITIVGASRSNGLAWASIRHVGITVVENGREVAWKLPPAKPENPAERDAFAGESYNDRSWANIPVPANWEMEGFSRPTYDNPDDAVGLYRRSIEVPQSFAGKRILWHFDGVWDGAEIFINGRRVGYHESGFTAFDMDVTAFLEPGQRNLLALRVSKNTPSVDLDTGDYWSLGGIYRENYLVALPRNHVADITVKTDLDAQYRDAVLHLAVDVAGEAGSALSVQGALFESDGGRVPGVSLEGRIRVGAAGNGVVNLQAPVAAPRLWSAEKPNLYYVVLTLSQSGKVVERVQERFGFRQVEIKNGVVLWNGVPIKCTGSCRHEEWAAYGHALTEKCWRTDLTLMKGCNINAIRTSHYNHAARFLELCDEMGIYVLDEVPACWCNLQDPRLKAAFVERTQETLQRDKNRPCVLAWSLTNESGYGPNAAAMLDYCKANDPTRPAFVSQCGPWDNPKIDFVDTHYPSIGEVRRLATDKLRATNPLVMTEQPHIFYVADGLNYDYGEKDLWGQVLARNWSVVWPTDSIVGSFIWEWQDQGIADKYPGKDADEVGGLRGNNGKGIVDGYRNVKPEYWNVKMVYSPVTTAAREVTPANGACTVSLQNRFSFTDLSELTCRWQALRGDKVLASGTRHIACPPRSSVEATFPTTEGMEYLRLEFIHPDGRSLYAARLQVHGVDPHPAPAALPAAGPVKLDDRAGEIVAEAAGTQLTVDKQTGMIRSWRAGGQDLVVGGPILNLGEQRVNHGDHDARNFIESETAPRLQSVQVTGRMAGESAEIAIQGVVYIVPSSERKGNLAVTLAMHPNGQVEVRWKLHWDAANANAWELGLKLVLPSALDTFAWSRTGLWTEYPKDHIGATEGVVTAKDLSFHCTKRDTRWVELRGKAAASLTALPLEGPLHTRARAEKEGTVLFLSSQVASPFDFSTNLVPDLLIHLTQGGDVSGGFVLQPSLNKP